ncbi:MAG: hypothetical protein P1P88_09915, partial [Bacteroidales bacterium]|nr:hypothetical protein [Bacteroidales bacterium]
MKALLKQLMDLFLILWIVVCLFAAGRAIFIFTHINSFENFSSFELFTAFYKGIYYDFLTTVFLNILFIFLFLWPSKIYNSFFYQSILKILFFIGNSVALISNLLDISFYSFSGHRLRAYEFKSEIFRFLNAFSTESIKELINSYLSLMIFFVAFVIILWLSLKLIKRRDTELGKLKTARRILSFLILIVFTGWASFSYFDKQIWLSSLYQRVDRRLVPITINNPYLLIRSTSCNRISADTEWEFGTYESQKEYNFLNEEVPEHIKLVIFENANVGFPELDSSFTNKGITSHLFSSLQTGHENMIKVLDEILLSFPTIFYYHFYQSIYSLNRFENLIGLLQKSGYKTNISAYGYDKKMVQIIDNFYGFYSKNDNKARLAKTFELILVGTDGGMVPEFENKINELIDLGGEDNFFIVAINNGSGKQPLKQPGLTNNMKVFASFELPFRKDSGAAISQYLDIKPTILHLINYQEPFVSYGS